MSAAPAPVNTRYSLDPVLAAEQRQRDTAILDRIVAMTPEQFRAWRETPPAWLTEED